MGELEIVAIRQQKEPRSVSKNAVGGEEGGMGGGVVLDWNVSNHPLPGAVGSAGSYVGYVHHGYCPGRVMKIDL